MQKKESFPVINVGIPYPGSNVKIVDDNGNELGYNQRGELLIQSKTAMKAYYNKPELTNKVLKNGWIHTGDIFNINENGILFFWGRADDKIIISDNSEIYLFDIAEKIRSDKDVSDVVVNSMPLKNDEISIVAHIIFSSEFKGDRNLKFSQIDSYLNKVLPKNILIDGYKEHFNTFDCSATTLKKDRKKLLNEFDGYIKIINNVVCNISYERAENEKLSKRCYRRNLSEN